MRTQYSDIIKKKIKSGNMIWLFEQLLQYMLIHASYAAGRAFCGPILGTFISTYNCNCHCFMCGIVEKGNDYKKKSTAELNTYEAQKLFDNFAKLGVRGIGFTGGEPLLREDIMILLEYVKKNGMIAHLNTNGLLLNKQNIGQLLDIGIDSLAISLDGACSKTHDSIRGYDGAFQKILDVIEVIIDLRKKRRIPLRLKIVTVISERNIYEILDIVKLALETKVDCIEFIPMQDFLDTKTLPLSKSKNELNELIEDLLRFKEQGANIENSVEHLRLIKQSFSKIDSPLRCYAGYNSCVVDCYGNIFPCVPWANYGWPVGNIKDSNLAEFWYSNEYNKTRSKIAKCRRCYLNCQAELNLMFNLNQRIARFFNYI